MPYQFKRYVSSLKTGRSYPAGANVPASLSNPAVIAAMLASGDIEEIIEAAPIPEPAPLEQPVEEVKPTRKKAKK